ncbi:MAG: PQQ-binding-like beta-propeller repeat protein [bacterium]
MRQEDMLFVGIKGRVLALDRNSGATLWETKVKGGAFGDSFVNLFFDRGSVFAATQGVLFCLDATTGRIQWENPLKGCGYGIATLASVAGASGNAASIAYKRDQDATASSSAASATASS